MTPSEGLRGAEQAGNPVMRIYLSGPMRSQPDMGRAAFHRAAALLRDAGYGVFSPAEHDITSGHLGEAGLDIRKALADDLAWICAHADGVVTLPGWRGSRGARAEVACALAISLPVWELGPFLTHGPESPYRIDVESRVRDEDGRRWSP